MFPKTNLVSIPQPRILGLIKALQKVISYSESTKDYIKLRKSRLKIKDIAAIELQRQLETLNTKHQAQLT